MLTILATLALTQPVHAKRSVVNAEAAVSVEVALVDGSNLVGVPDINMIEVTTTYGEMQLPLRMVRRLTVLEGGKQATFEMRNGDRFEGTVALSAIKLQTIFGSVRLPLEQVATVQPFASPIGRKGLPPLRLRHRRGNTHHRRQQPREPRHGPRAHLAGRRAFGWRRPVRRRR